MREVLQTMYRINRDKTVVEALLFVGWCLIFYFAVSNVNDVQVMFSSNNALYNAFVNQEIPRCALWPTCLVCLFLRVCCVCERHLFVAGGASPQCTVQENVPRLWQLR